MTLTNEAVHGSIDEELEESCPVCRRDRYLDPAMQLLVTPCYHKICDSCVARIFAHGAAPCPLCQTTLRRGNIVRPTFVDLRVEKEVRIRRIVSRSLNKRPEDFESSREHNDYLEEMEDIVMGLVDDVDVQKTYDKLEKLRTDNRELIQRNLAKQQNEEKEVERLLVEEKKELEDSNMEALRLMEAEERLVDEERNKLIDELATSDKPAAAILAKRPVLAQQLPSSVKHARDRQSTSNDTVIIRPQIKPSARRPDEMSIPFDPLESVHPTDFPFDLNDLMEDIGENVFLTQNFEDRMRAGGCTMESICQQTFIAAFSWGF